MKNNLQDIAQDIHREVVDISYKAGVGHIGSALSIVDILTTLYFEIMSINPKKPNLPSRDRLILSKGHGAAALFVILYKRGFFSRQILDGYCQNGGLLAEHPEIHIPGVENTSGSLGHGLSLGVGMAIAAKKDGLGYRTFVILSDGECDEGSIWEAALAAGNFNLDNLVVIIDYNKFQAFGRTKDVMNLEPFADKWQSFGFETREIDGHNMQEITTSLKKMPLKKNKPSVFIAHTIIGKGLSFFEDRQESHYNSLTPDQYLQAQKELS